MVFNVLSLHVGQVEMLILNPGPGPFQNLISSSLAPPSTLPLTSTWPHLNSDVGLDEGEY